MITEKNNVFYCDCGFSFLRGHSGAHDCAVGLRNKLSKSEARCAALAAENAGLKAALNPKVIPDAAVEAFNETAIMDHDWNETSEWSWVENDTDVIRAVLESIKPDTPATDAFLAEVRAQGVDVAIEHLINKFEGTGRIGVPIMALEWLSKELRKGVRS
ncbi:hypothetical protein [Enterobacter sp. RHBSTW-00593]|uniref:hypothetical protein n=1 Tax=Enterobacter sp. RHBSTW-00593 TaxID=2742656 RepID=UPI0015E9A69C|nr:hypothetical protein [Enterobacter sp. RHBSTW-00593]QLX96253.1 hypothetical protein HV242_15590 [Enterobacter sp. RHBSTW-00593]QLX96254.1 hypothetical protein HV242_15875 [Enterobacter sp. RHBSTW-00593]